MNRSEKKKKLTSYHSEIVSIFPGDSKKSNSSKKRGQLRKNERPEKKEFSKEPDKILYNEEDRQNRLKKSFLVKNNDLPYQNAASFAQLMKELKDKFNATPKTNASETKLKNSVSQTLTTTEKVDSARKKLYNFLERKPARDTKVQELSQHRYRTFSSCESAEPDEYINSHNSDMLSSFSSQSENLQKNEHLTDSKRPSRQRKYREQKPILISTNKNKLHNDPDVEEKHSEAKGMSKRFRSTNGESKIYFFKKNISEEESSFHSTRSIISNDSKKFLVENSSSLDPSKFRNYLKPLRDGIKVLERKRSMDSIKTRLKLADSPGRTSWVQDENKNWRKISV